jgi:hypothetical protein
MGTKRIQDENVGTEMTQCGKFARFKEIYQDFRRDPNPAVANLVRGVDGSRRQFDMVILSPFKPEFETQAHYIDRIQQFITMVEGQKQIYRRQLAFIPDSADYGQLKDELRFFIPFMFNYYVQAMKELLPIGLSNNSSRKLNWEGTNSTRTSNASNISNWSGGRRLKRNRKTRKARKARKTLKAW